MTNKHLNRVRFSEGTDEFYTPYNVVESELRHYSAQFANMRILCNGNDPLESNFTRYFLNNFKRLNLCTLTAISYKSFATSESYVITVTRENCTKIPLSRVDTFKEFWNDIDIVVTNPPFSLFKRYVDCANAYKVKYLLLGNQNSLSYSTIFPLIMKEETRIGYNWGSMKFKVPKGSQSKRESVDKKGNIYKTIGNGMWLTNLEVTKSVKPLELRERYIEGKYLKYDGTDVIHVPTVQDIPIDYDGVMGVPITFFQYYDKDRFTLVGEANHGRDNEYDLFKPIIGGREVFKRLLITYKSSQF